ncbi:PilZ domain-containing protein [Methylorubrum salsuginis]|uniref:PilZ domain-containing protein n=1 Tax=Methylorubrum salsuginis TaxID=414703 RepID=A0A1I4L8K4_9HYPH|nr:PilZ domain-containing protein [Methylorubrum salsuginis]SFL87290.1 PilZ domain-containing protein [Methylorubrum salsuginis]
MPRFRELLYSQPLPGHCLLPDGREQACIARRLSPLGAELALQARARAGDPVTCRLDRVGLLHGHVTDPSERGFTVVFALTDARRERLAARIAWLSACADGRVEQRAAPRIVPVHPEVALEFEDGFPIEGRILDLSPSGAAIALDGRLRPLVGQKVKVGKRYAEVVRILEGDREGGMAVRFRLPFSPETFNPSIVL